MRKVRPSILAVSIIILLAGCASYNAEPLQVLTHEVTLTNDVSIAVKAFDTTDCKRYLDRDVIAKGYQPIQVYIENHSNNNFIFSLQRINLPYARSDEVANRVHTSTVGRAVGYGIGALFIWPLAIPAIVDGIKSAEANSALDTDFLAKTAKDQIIHPHSYFNKIIFVPLADYSAYISMGLLDPDSNTLIKFERQIQQ